MNYKNLINSKIAIFSALIIIITLLISVNAFSNIRPDITDNLYGNQEPLDNILIIKIDDPSLQKIGRWPWDRVVFASLLEKTKDAKVIGIDVSFFEPSPLDENLKFTLENLDNVILASELNDGIIYKPIFQSKHGVVNLVADYDGVVRTFNPSANSEKAFAFEIYKEAWNPKATYPSKKSLINFVGPPNSFESISAHQVLESNISFGNKIVLIGATAPSLQDNFFVPTSSGVPMPGVEIHATILQNLILDNFINQQGRLSLSLLTILAAFIGFFLLSRLKAYYGIPIIILAIIIYYLIAIYSFNNHNYLIDLFFIPLSLIIFTSTGFAVNYLEERKQNLFLKNAFSKYINKPLLQQIIEQKHKLKLGGKKETITLFFSDIRGFTKISESLKPNVLVSLINEYLNEMTKIILLNKGTLDKFIGDAIMAFWNAPLPEKNHAEIACTTALQQLEKLKKLQKSWKKRNLPQLKIGIGINTGEAVIGNMGSQERFDYTAMGDAVNLTSRLEGLSKNYETDIIISENTYQLVKHKFNCNKLGKVKVKGKKKPITIYALISKK
jgi:adenylate cyclase